MGRPFPGLVAEDEDDADERSVLAANGGAAVGDGALPPALGDEHGVIGQTDHGAFSQYFRHGAFDLGAGLLVDDAEHLCQGAALGLRFAPARERFGHGVHEANVPFRAGGDDAVADAAQGGAELLERLPAFAFGAVETLKHALALVLVEIPRG